MAIEFEERWPELKKYADMASLGGVMEGTLFWDDTDDLYVLGYGANTDNRVLILLSEEGLVHTNPIVRFPLTKVPQGFTVSITQD